MGGHGGIAEKGERESLDEEGRRRVTNTYNLPNILLTIYLCFFLSSNTVVALSYFLVIVLSTMMYSY